MNKYQFNDYVGMQLWQNQSHACRAKLRRMVVSRSIFHCRRTVPMPLIRCPNGCYFNLPALNWGVFLRFPDSQLVCDVCHRSSEARAYGEDARSAAVSAVSGVSVPNQTRQLEIETSMQLRISRLMGNINWFGYQQDILIKQLYNKIVQLLLKAELTSNFPTPRLWKMLASAGVMKNMWALGSSSKDAYGMERDSGEKKLFMELSTSVSIAPTGDGRPIYIALSPGCLQQGGAPPYGQSYVVYKDAVKMRCTYTATDTLQMLKSPDSIDICSITTIANVLLRVSDRELQYLCSLAGVGEAASPNEFIEAQGWGQISWANDVQIIVISQPDLDHMLHDRSTHQDLMPAELLELSLGDRVLAIAKMKRELQVFCTLHGIKLMFLDLSGATMNSRQRRPD
ncbi:DUF3626 domain-containing protein [Janthinobacterium sp. PSPC3-1]|uniref:DUF3626 domain-containing protein n=2 Tax=unclassified Janthinobacterium TaxID=2610881 RepID=UPI003CF9439F